MNVFFYLTFFILFMIAVHLDSNVRKSHVDFRMISNKTFRVYSSSDRPSPIIYEIHH